MQGHKSITSSIQPNNRLNKKIFGQMQSLGEAAGVFQKLQSLERKK